MQKVNLTAVKIIWETNLNITGVWLFGSARNNLIKAGSDLDMGILFAVSPGLDELADLRKALQLKLNIDQIDLLILNKAGVVSRFEAISGRLLFCRNRDKCAEFVSCTAREYEDEMAFLQRGLTLKI
ncbi:MAG: nucleotidyltransferase domain-containing protein [Deltaproteobacteria bacterium]|nr:nucleotidyltransferase domain-containing protein [Deltaproteobacteria bacterium]